MAVWPTQALRGAPVNEGQGRVAPPEPSVTQKHGLELSQVVQPQDAPASGAWLDLADLPRAWSCIPAATRLLLLTPAAR